MKDKSKGSRAARRQAARGATATEPGVRSTVAARSASPRASAGRGAIAAFVHEHSLVVLLALCSLHLLLALVTFMPQPHTGGDSANYMTLARSLLENQSYTDLYDPIQPPHTKYPPVFPLMLAAGMAVGLTTWVQLKLVMVAIGTAAVAFTFLWIRKRGRPLLALAVSLMLAFSPGVVDQSHWLLSDVPFWFFTMVALWAFDRLHANDRARMAIAIAATILAYFTRSAGLPLVVACVLWFAWRRRWRQLAVFVAIFAPLALMWWLRAQNTGGVAYTKEFWLVNPYMPELGTIGVADFFKRMGENAVKYATTHIPILLAGRTGMLLSVAAVSITGFALYGWIVRLRRAMVAELLMPLYIGLLLAWPAVWSGERFIMPIFPLLLYYAGLGLTRVARRITPRHVVPVGAAITAVFILADMPALNASIAIGRSCTNAYMRGETYPCLHPTERAYFDAAIWSNQYLPSNAVVISRKPRLFYEISNGVRGSNYPMSMEAAPFFSLADSIGARYVVYDRLSGSLAEAYLAPVLLARPQAFCMAERFDRRGTTMFGILPGASRMPDQPVPLDEEPSFVTCDPSYYR